MSFADQYQRSLDATNLMDDAFHHNTEALQASAHADKVARNIGALLSRVKYSDGPLGDLKINHSPNLTELRKKWLEVVIEKGEARKWIRIRGEWDLTLAIKIYNKVATESLDYFLDGICRPCGGTGSQKDDRALLRTCSECKGTGRGKLPPMTEYEKRLVQDMVAELEALESSHAGCASKLMRRDV